VSTHDPEAAAILAFSAAMCEEDAPERIRDDLPGYLESHGVDAADRELIARHREQLLVYRSMVHSRLRGVIAEYLPRTVAVLGKPRLRSDLAAFMAERAPHSVYFRRVPHEFFAWAAPRWRRDPALPPHLVDLASHELLDAEVSDSVGGGEPASGHPLALEHPVQLDGSVALRRYAFAVHRPPRSFARRSPARRAHGAARLSRSQHAARPPARADAAGRRPLHPPAEQRTAAVGVDRRLWRYRRDPQ
jgi:hypothetical protein